ncbi:hypothetical protein BB560_003435 [Smittium megazygosporum]|uniref:DNA primase n=1 Tax=Smittium megazygosporum TaxID=133381 RepID=A0A2T9ZC01_9FUNG|nr:hypothetical protein BB560_003435 [Smittium megazygosporum]
MTLDTDQIKAETKEPVLNSKAPVQEEVSKMHMDQYYKRLFPFETFYKWLNYSTKEPTQYLKNREFSFTIENDIYLRYQSFASFEEMKREIIAKCPNKIDIGAIYNIPPKLAKTVQSGVLKPQEKELVFDIDMTDYDDIRTCCTGGDICHKCWGWMSAAMKILNEALRALQLDNSARKAIINYLSVIRGGEDQSKKVNIGIGENHPHIQRSLKIANSYFKKVVLGSQNVLKFPSGWKKMLEIIPVNDLKTRLDAKWSKENEELGIPNNPKINGSVNSSAKDEDIDMDTESISIERWEELVDCLEQEGNKKSKERIYPATLISEIVLQYVYPRLDENVSTHLNHLLKSPFCIHPKTGKVCVPIGHHEIDKFDPMTAPTIFTLLKEIDNYDSTNTTEEGRSSVPDIEKTSLKKYTKMFDMLVNKIPDTDPSRKDNLSF